MAETRLPTDTFSTVLRGLEDNPGAMKAESTIHTRDFYGNTSSWIVRTFRADGETWMLLQRNGVGDGDNLREVLPPEVAAVILRHDAQLVSRARRRGARQAVETKRSKGIAIGNTAALAKARGKRGKR